LYLLLLAPFVGTLWVSLYARDKPRLFGFPFFYWYQLAWVIAASGITAFVYVMTTPRRAAPPEDEGDPAYPGGPSPRHSREGVR
jgi:hypothetical protein